MNLLAQWRGPHVLIRHAQEPQWEHPWLGWAPCDAAEPFVMLSELAAREPLHTAAELAASTLGLPSRAPRARAVRFGIPQLAAAPARARVVREVLGVDVVLPDGEFATSPGAALFAGHGTSSSGWYRFDADLRVHHHACRYPSVPWESAVPHTESTVDGVTTVPVPAGIAVRHSWAPPATTDDAAFAVPVEHRRPKVVVGEGDPVPSPEQVADVLRRLRLAEFVVVPTHPEVAEYTWQRELATLLDTDVVFAAGTQVASTTGIVSTFSCQTGGDEPFRPVATVLGQPARGGGQDVLDVCAPPRGWYRSGTRSLSRDDGHDGVVAEVVPSGIVVTDDPAHAEPDTRVHDPYGWTLTIGTADTPLERPVLRCARELVDALDSAQRAAMRVEVPGSVDESLRRSAEFSFALSAHARDENGPRVGGGSAGSTSTRPDRTPGDDLPDFTAVPADYRDSDARTDHADGDLSVSPVPTVSYGPAAVGGHESRTERAGEQPAADGSGDCDVAATAQTEPAQWEHSRDDADDIHTAQSDSGTDGQATDPPAEVAPSGPRERASTAGERGRFAEMAGDAYTEALGVVNTAMATWPALRRGDNQGVKTDFAAVWLYLRAADDMASRVNDAVRAGEDTPIAGHLPCLVSGLRRLPTHRRAVLRQGFSEQAWEHRGRIGTVLCEPGFVNASTELDVASPDALFDVLIWPSSARRTAELLRDGAVDEAIFMAGARFKALAVRTATEPEDEPTDAGDATEGVEVEAPKEAVLLRELAPDESAAAAELDERDLAVLRRLDHALARRRATTIRPIGDSGATARLSAPIAGFADARSGTPAQQFSTARAVGS